MTEDPCQQFLEDPESHPEHGASCASCGALMRELEQEGVPASPSPIAQSIGANLPMASWEGASHRSWAFLFAVLLLLVGTVAGLFLIAGISPVTGFAETLRIQSGSGLRAIGVAQAIGGFVRHAPIGFHIAIAVAFVVVNVVFVALLRRAPKGIDVTPR